MGSWSETCNLSNLPIIEDDEVVFMLLVRDRPGNIFVASLPIYGAYRDCGEVTLAPGQKERLNLLEAQWYSAFQVERDFDYIQEKLARAGMCLEEDSYLHRILIRMDVWDGMLKQSVGTWRGGPIISYGGFTQGVAELEDAIENLPHPDDSLYELSLDLIKEKSYGYLNYGFRRTFESESFSPQPFGCMGTVMARIVDAKAGYEDFLEPDTLHGILAPLAELRYVEFLMCQARMSWAVPDDRYVGSQTANFALSANLHKLMGDIAESHIDDTYA